MTYLRSHSGYKSGNRTLSGTSLYGQDSVVSENLDGVDDGEMHSELRILTLFDNKLEVSC